MYTVMRTGYVDPYQNTTNKSSKYREKKKEETDASLIANESEEENDIPTLQEQKEQDNGKGAYDFYKEETDQTNAMKEFIERMKETAAAFQEAREESGKTNLYDATMDLMLIANVEKEPALRAIHAKLLFKSRAIRTTTGADSDAIRIALRKIGKVIGKTKSKIKKLQKEELLEKKRKKAEAEKRRKMAEELQKELDRKRKIRKNRERQDVEESKMGMGANYGGEPSKFSPTPEINSGITTGASGDILSQVEGVDMSPVSVGGAEIAAGSAVAAEASLGTSVDVFL